MEETNRTATFDEQAAIAAIRADTKAFSSTNPDTVELLRRLTARRMSASEISLLLHLGSRSRVIGVIHRAKIKTVNRPGPWRNRKPRHGPAVKPAALPPRDSASGLFLMPLPPKMSPDAVARVRARRRHAPQCLWAGCREQPMAQGKPYCRTHHVASGALV